MSQRLLSIPLVLASVCVAWLGTPANAASILSQPPCAASGFCLSFNRNSSVPEFRSFAFTLTAPKTAQVTFNGSLICQNSGPSPDRVIEFDSQIVTGNAAVSTGAGPGKLRLMATLHHTDFVSFVNFNLATTRVIEYPSTGNKTVRFKIRTI